MLPFSRATIATLVLTSACEPTGHCYVPNQCGAEPDTGIWHDGANPDLSIWAVEDAFFDDGAKLRGYLVVQDDLGVAMDWSLCATARPDDPEAYPAVHYLPSTSASGTFDDAMTFDTHALYGPWSNSHRSLRLRIRDGVDRRARTISLVDSYECVNCGSSRYLVEGALVARDAVDGEVWCPDHGVAVSADRPR